MVSVRLGGLPRGARRRQGRLSCRAWLRPDPGTRCGRVPRESCGAPELVGDTRAPRHPFRPRRLFSAVVVLTLLVTAFGTWSSAPVATQPLAAANVLPGGQPLPQIVATAGAVQLQLPVAQTAVTAIGYHNAGDGSLALDPVGRQGNAGLFARIWHRLVGDKREPARLVPAAGPRRAWHPRRSPSAPRPARTSTRPSTGPSSGSPTSCSRTARPAPGSTFGRTLRPPWSSP